MGANSKKCLADPRPLLESYPCMRAGDPAVIHFVDDVKHRWCSLTAGRDMGAFDEKTYHVGRDDVHNTADVVERCRKESSPLTN